MTQLHLGLKIKVENTILLKISFIILCFRMLIFLRRILQISIIIISVIIMNFAVILLNKSLNSSEKLEFIIYLNNNNFCFKIGL